MYAGQGDVADGEGHMSDALKVYAGGVILAQERWTFAHLQPVIWNCHNGKQYAVAINCEFTDKHGSHCALVDYVSDQGKRSQVAVLVKDLVP